MLKVLHAFGDFIPLTHCWAYRLIRHLEDVEVHLAAQRFIKNEYYPPPYRFYEYPIGFIGRPRTNLLEKSLNKLMNFSHRWYPNYLQWVMKPADLIHSHFGTTATAFHSVARKKRLPHIVSMYGADYTTRMAYEAYLDKYRILFKEAALFLVEGPAAADNLAKMGCPREKLKVLRLGIEPDTIPTFRRKKEPGSLNLVQVATWREKKGHDTTLEAFRQALPACPNATLTLLGGDFEGRKQRLLEPYLDLIESGKIKLAEAMPLEQLYTFLENFHVFIHPSRRAEDGDSEGGAPVVLLDAQATGMPVLATTHCDIPQEVLHDKTGWLMEEGDASGLAEGIERFYAMDQANYEAFSSRAIQHVKQAFDVRQSALQLREIYTEVAGA